MAAAKTAYAAKGFTAVHDGELAETAGVSKKTLTEHFPTKDALYSAMSFDIPDESHDGQELHRYISMPASTFKLVLLVHHFIWMLINRPDPVIERLQLRSWMEDGEFSRVFLNKFFREHWLAQFEACLPAAEESGDLEPTGLSAEYRGWCVHNLAASFAKHFAAATPSVEYRLPREEVVRSAVVFALRGIGFTHQAIKTHYNHKSED